MGLYIFFLSFKYKVEYAVVMVSKKKEKRAADHFPLLSVSGLSGHSLYVKFN